MCTEWNTIFVIEAKKLADWVQGSESSGGAARTGEQAAKGSESWVCL